MFCPKTQGENGLKTLKAQPLLESDYADVRKQLEGIFYQIIFRPLVDLLAPHNAQVKIAAREIRNAAPLGESANRVAIAAINSGRIQYEGGVFSGDFNSTISRALLKIGAKFNKREATFSLAPNEVPTDVRAAAQHSNDLAKKLHSAILDELDRQEATMEQAVTHNKVDAGIMVGKVQRGFAKSVGDALGNSDLTDESRAKLKSQYADSLKPYIKKFASDTVAELREAVEANALAGYRFDTLVKRIQSRSDVSKTKAEFLARTETARYVSLHRRVRFEEAGIKQYIWRTAGDARVREDHRKLNGQVFWYDHPPVIDDSTGERGNPGMIYNCRCSDEPILPNYKNYTTPTVKNSVAARSQEAVTC